MAEKMDVIKEALASASPEELEAVIALYADDTRSGVVKLIEQARIRREKLAKLLNISNEQLSYITNADAGCGLIKYGSALVPFVNRFPKDTKLYQLMTTRPGEGKFSGQAV